MRRPHRILPTLALAALGASAALTGCGGDEADGGFASARAAVEAHADAAGRFDLAGTCELLSPDRREEMASFDGEDADGYCERATADVVASASAETKARARSIYADATIEPTDRAPGTWFRIEAVDGTFAEDVEVTEVDGRWWVAHVESDVDDHDHEEDEGADGHDEDDHEEPSAETGGAVGE